MFPGIKEVKSLKKRLENIKSQTLSTNFDLEINQVLFSSIIDKVSNTNFLPYALLKDWVWILCQLRLKFIQKQDFLFFYVLLIFFKEIFEDKNLETEKKKKYLAWLTYNSIDEARARFGIDERFKFLSQSDENKVYEKLREFEHISKDESLGEINNNFERVIKYFNNIKSEGFVTGIISELNEIKTFCQNDDSTGVMARSCLLYLISDEDAIKDSIGYAGLMDDLFVIERTHRELLQKKTWGNLLKKFQKKYPFLDEIVFYEGEEIRKSPQIVQLISALSIEKTTTIRKCFITPDVGPLSIITALFLVLNKYQKKIFNEKKDFEYFQKLYPIGSHIMVPLEDKKLFFQIKDYKKEFDGEIIESVYLKCSDGSKIIYYKDLEHAVLCNEIDKKKLSSAKKLTEWQGTHTINPFEYWIDIEKMNSSSETPFFLFCSKEKVEFQSKKIKPMQKSISESIGVKWTTSGGIETNLSLKKIHNNVSAVHDVYILRELLDENYSEHLIVDGLKYAKNLIPELRKNVIDEKLPITIFLNESECSARLNILNKKEWIIKELQKHNFEIIPISNNSIQNTFDPIKIINSGPFTSFINKIQTQNKITVNRIEVNHDQIDELYFSREYLALDYNEDSFFISMRLNDFLRELAKYVIALDENSKIIIKEKIQAVLELSEMQSTEYSNYITNSLRNFKLEEEHPKFSTINSLLNEFKNKFFFLLCDTQIEKDMNEEFVSKNTNFTNLKFITSKEIKEGKNVENLIITSTFKKVFTNYKVSGAVKNIYLIYYKEENQRDIKWDEKGAKFRKFLEQSSDTILKNIDKKIDDSSYSFKGLVLENVNDYSEENPSDIELFEDEIDNKFFNNVYENYGSLSASRDSLAEVEIITFRDLKSFCFLPKNGRNFCFNFEKNTIENKLTSELKPNNILVISDQSNYSLLNNISKKYLLNFDKTFDNAQLWKKGLLKIFNENGSDINELKKILDSNNIKRNKVTLSNWLLSSDTIAPRGYKQKNLIEIIAKISDDRELLANWKKVINSIDEIYNAREKGTLELIDNLEILISKNKSLLDQTNYQNKEVIVNLDFGESKFTLCNIRKVIQSNYKVDYKYIHKILLLDEMKDFE